MGCDRPSLGVIPRHTSRQTPLSSSPKTALLPVHSRTGTDVGQRSRFIWKWQRSRFMWGNGPGLWQQPGPMLRRPTRGALRGIGPGCWPQPGLLPCLYKPPSQHFATLPQKIQHCVGVGWVLEFFSFDCTPGVRRNVQATLRSSEHRILGRG